MDRTLVRILSEHYLILIVCLLTGCDILQQMFYLTSQLPNLGI